MTEKAVRDTFSDYGIWLDPDLEGEYTNGKGYKCYVRVSRCEQDGKWEVSRYISTFYGLEDCEDYIASKEVKSISQLKEVLEAIINLPEKIQNTLWEI